MAFYPKRLYLFLLIALTLAGISSCHYAHEDDSWVTAVSDIEVDSTDFRRTHHYWRGYNFYATDTFRVASRPPFEPQLTYTADSTRLITAQDVLVIESIRKDTAAHPAQIWLKIAAVESGSYANTMVANSPISGWINEAILLKNAVPDTPVSRIIHTLGSKIFKQILFFSALLLTIGLLILARNRRLHTNSILYSPYRILLLLLLSGGIVLHRSIWHFVPDTWVEYYFYPSLNPFNPLLPPIIALFVTNVWLILLAGIAVLDESRHHTESIPQLLAGSALLCGQAIVMFAVFAVVCPFMLLYPLLVIYWVALIWGYVKYCSRATSYYCGNCGRIITRLGICPECGAKNE